MSNRLESFGADARLDLDGDGDTDPGTADTE